MSEWVRADEWLPKENKAVLLIQKTGYKDNRVMVVGRWVKEKTIEVFDDPDNFLEYCEDSDSFYIPEGWYEDIQNWDDYEFVKIPGGYVTHWMPLPDEPEGIL